jgi:hypothetical protein
MVFELAIVLWGSLTQNGAPACEQAAETPINPCAASS